LEDANNNTVTTDSSTVVTMSSSSANVQFTGNPKTLSSGTFTISTLDNYFETITITATDANSKTGNTTVTVNPLNGDYQSRATGNWNALGTWSTWSGSAWANALAAPTSSTTGLISVTNTTVTVTASVTASNLVIVVGGTVSISGSQTLTVGNGLANGVISGAGILAESGTGTVLDLNGANTYTGGTVINSGGTVSISSDSNLGNTSGGITIAGGTLQTTGSSAVTTARAITLSTGGGVLSIGIPLYFTGAISGGTGLTIGGNDLILNRASGNNTIGPITVNSGRLFVFTLNSINASSIAVQSGATLDFNVSGGASPANAMTFASGSCLANRIGTLTLSTATGFPTSGTMIINSDDQNTTAIIVNGNYPALTGNLTIQDGPSGQPTPIVGAVTLSGAISGSGGLIKTYPGTLILGSANTYTQGTTVSAGTLDAYVAGSLSTRDVNVASGAVLQLDTSTGMSSTARLLLSGASPSVTLTTGINQTVGGLSFDSGATFQASGTWGASGKTHNDSRFTGSGALTVSPIALIVTAVSNTKTYDGTTSAAATPALTSGTLSSGDTATYSETYSTKEVGTGSKTVIPAVTIKDGGNVDVTASYTITLTSVSTGTISAKALSVGSPTIASKIYDGTATAGAVIVGTLSGFVGSETVTATGTAAAYSSANANTYNGLVVAYTLQDGTGGGLAANYSLANGTATGVINPKALTVTASPQSKTYGTSLSLGTNAFSVGSGLVGSESVTAVTLTASGGTAATDAVGSYSITPSVATGTGGFLASNYNISYATGTLTVNKAALTVTASAQAKTYGQTVTFGSGSTSFTSSGLQNGETIGTVTLAVSGSGGAATAPVLGSPYTITPSTATGGTFTAGNYNITYATGTLTVSTAGTTSAVTSSANPAQPGASVMFTSTLNVTAPGGGTPTGSVSFKDGASVLGTGSLNGSGVATFSTSSLAHGNHVITAEYAGDGNFLGSTNSLGTNQVINTAPVASLATYTRSSGLSWKILISSLLSNSTSDADGDARTLTAVGSSTNGATITKSGTWIFYVPPPASNVNSNATDYFSYTISDGFAGGTNSGMIRMAVTDPSIGAPSANLIVLTTVTNGIAVSFVGIPGYAHHVQRTTTLNGTNTAWSDLGICTVNAAGKGVFTDTSPPSPAYYRTSWP
jgi:autotransporter-associated beta strand protein